MMGWYAVYRREMLLMRRKIGKLGYVFSTLLFPLIYLLSFGWGFGNVVEVEGGYIAYLAKGMVSITVMMNAFQQTSLSVSVARFYFRTFQTILISPVPVWQAVFGIALAGVTRGVIAGGLIYGLAMLMFDAPLISLWGMLGVIFAAFCFAALGIAIGMMVDQPDALSVVINFIITPMTFFCGSFFPIANLPELVQYLVKILPLSLANDLLRMEHYSWTGLNDMTLLILMGMLMFYIGIYKIKNYSE